MQAKNQAFFSIEQNGAAAAFEKCRQLADQICAELWTKKPGIRPSLPGWTIGQVLPVTAAVVTLELDDFYQ
jgi:hypothetical protein